MIVNIIVALVIFWLLSKLFSVFRGYQNYRYYKEQGVVFTDNSWSLLRDVKALIGVIKKYPTSISYLRLFRA